MKTLLVILFTILANFSCLVYQYLHLTTQNVHEQTENQSTTSIFNGINGRTLRITHPQSPSPVSFVVYTNRMIFEEELCLNADTLAFLPETLTATELASYINSDENIVVVVNGRRYSLAEGNLYLESDLMLRYAVDESGENSTSYVTFAICLNTLNLEAGAYEGNLVLKDTVGNEHTISWFFEITTPESEQD